jgi:amino acid permease
MLLMRRHLAEKLLLVSLVAVIVQFSALLLVPELRNLTTSDVLLLPFVIIVAAYVIWHFAWTSRRAGWLR